MCVSAAPELALAFTLNVELAPPQTIGTTIYGDQRFIPITGGTITGPKLTGNILAGGGDWNLVRPDDLVHLLAKYTISLTEDNGSETLVTITNEGIGRANRAVMEGVFNADDPSEFSNGSMGTGKSVVEGDGEGDGWYTRTSPKFEVRVGSKYQWLCCSLWLGVLRPPQRQGEVVIDVFQVR